MCFDIYYFNANSLFCFYLWFYFDYLPIRIYCPSPKLSSLVKAGFTQLSKMAVFSISVRVVVSVLNFFFCYCLNCLLRKGKTQPAWSNSVSRTVVYRARLIILADIGTWKVSAEADIPCQQFFVNGKWYPKCFFILEHRKVVSVCG